MTVHADGCATCGSHHDLVGGLCKLHRYRGHGQPRFPGTHIPGVEVYHREEVVITEAKTLPVVEGCPYHPGQPLYGCLGCCDEENA